MFLANPIQLYWICTASVEHRIALNAINSSPNTSTVHPDSRDCQVRNETSFPLLPPASINYLGNIGVDTINSGSPEEPGGTYFPTLVIRSKRALRSHNNHALSVNASVSIIFDFARKHVV